MQHSTIPIRWSSLPALAVLALLLVGFGLWTAPQPQAAGFAVGYVDVEAALRSHPKFTVVLQQVADYKTGRLKELDTFKNRELSDEEKRTLIVRSESINRDVDKKHDELFEPLAKDVQTALNAVGRSSKVEVILERAAVHFGGVDLTPALIAELKKY